MLKIRARKYPAGGWADWTSKLVSISGINKRTESEILGQSGVTVYDNSNITLYNDNIINAALGNVVPTDIWLIEISFLDTVLFIGVIDVATIKKRNHGKELSFEVMDKLSALSMLQKKTIMSEVTLNPVGRPTFEYNRYEINSYGILYAYTNSPDRALLFNVGDAIKDPLTDEWLFVVESTHSSIERATGNYDHYNDIKVAKRSSDFWMQNEISISGGNGVDSWDYLIKGGSKNGKVKNFTFELIDHQSAYVYYNLKPGIPYDDAIKQMNFMAGGVWDDGQTILPCQRIHFKGIGYDLTSSEIQAYLLPNGSTAYRFYIAWNAIFAPQIVNPTEIKKKLKGVYGRDCLAYDELGKPKGFDAYKVIEAMVKESWSDITVQRLFSEPCTLNIQYYKDLLGDVPFGDHPINALQKLANTTLCYIRIDRTGNLVIKSKDYFPISPVQDDSTVKVIDEGENYFWDKINDAVTAKGDSFFINESDNTDKLTVSYTKQQTTGIEPRNPLILDLLLSDQVGSSQESIELYLQSTADKAFSFYGKRHKSYPKVYNLDSTSVQWDSTDVINTANGICFMPNISYDLNVGSESITTELIVYEGIDFNLGQVLIIKDPATANNKSGGSTSQGYTSGGGSNLDAFKWDGGGAGLDPSLGRQSLQLDQYFSTKLHNHDTLYLGLHATADNSQLLDGYDSSEFAKLFEDETISGAWEFLVNPIIDGNVNWHSGNDGVGSGMDSDLWQGWARTSYLNQDVRSSASPSWLKVTSTAQNGTAPFIVASNTLVTNLNSDLWDGKHFDDYFDYPLKRNSDVVHKSLILTNNPNQTAEEKFHLIGNFKQENTFAYYSNGYMSGWGNTGFNLSSDVTGVSSLVVDKLTVRQTMYAYEFIIRQISAFNDNHLVSASGKVVSFANNSTYQCELTFENASGYAVSPFAPGDLIEAQQVDPSSQNILFYARGEVENVVGNVVYIYWNVAPAQISQVVNKVFVRVGNTYNADRQGVIYLASYDDNAPFIDVRDGVNNFESWNSSSTKVRLGKLTGITDADFGVLSGYGLYGSNVYLKGILKVLQGSNVAGWITAADSFGKFNVGATSGMGMYTDAWSTGIPTLISKKDNTFYSTIGAMLLGDNSSSASVFNGQGISVVDYGYNIFLAGKTLDYALLPNDDTIEPNTPFLWMGDAYNYLKYIPTNGLTVKGNIQSINGLLSVSDGSNDIIKIGTGFTNTPPDVYSDVSSSLLPEGKFNNNYTTNTTLINGWTRQNSNYSNTFTTDLGIKQEGAASLKLPGYQGAALIRTASMTITKAVNAAYINNSFEYSYYIRHGNAFAGASTIWDYYLTIEFLNSSNGVINTFFYYDYENTTTNAWLQRVIKFNIPETTINMRITYFFTTYNGTAVTALNDLFLDNITIKRYDKLFFWVNENKINIYNSPNNYIAIDKGKFDLSVTSIRINGARPVRQLEGFYSDIPDNAVAGDMWTHSLNGGASGQVKYKAYGGTIVTLATF